MKIKKTKLIEAVRKVIKEQDFEASKFPFPKPDTQGDYAKHVAQAGKPDKDGGDPADDVVPYQNRADLQASSLKPSQQEIKLGQALGMAISMLGRLENFEDGPGGDLDAIISGDGYIMDGHHRWAASILAAGDDVELGGKVIEMPGRDLVQVLALMGDALHPGERKKPDPHNIMNATADDVNNFINKFTEEGIPGFVDVATVNRVLEEKFGSIENAKTHFISQLPKIKKAPPEWAESRDKMPVLEPKQNEPEKVAKAMAAGDVDVYAPYADPPGNRQDKKGIKEMKFNKKRLTRLVKESLKKKLAEQAGEKNLQQVQRALDYAMDIDNKAEYRQSYGPILKQMMSLPSGVTAMDVAEILKDGLGDKIGPRIYQMIKGETSKASDNKKEQGPDRSSARSYADEAEAAFGPSGKPGPGQKPLKQ